MDHDEYPHGEFVGADHDQQLAAAADDHHPADQQYSSSFMMKTVLLGFDNSEGSMYALKWILENLFFGYCNDATASTTTTTLTDVAVAAAAAADDRSSAKKNRSTDDLSSSGGYKKLVILHAYHPFNQNFIPAGPGVYVTPMVIESVRKGQEEHSQRLLAGALAMCNASKMMINVAVEGKHVEADPKEAICRVAQQIHADLIVVGSRGLGMIKRAFLGSVSDYVTHHASCPVLIVKPPPPPKGTH